MKAFADVHTHNFLSRCGNDRLSTVESYVCRAAELGLETLGISNHCWDERAPFPVEDERKSWYYKQSLTYVLQSRSLIPADTRGVRVLIGAETEYCGMSDALGMTPEGARLLDYLLVPHSHIHMRDFVMPQFPDVTAARENAAAALAAVRGISADTAKTLAGKLSYDELEPFMPGERTDRADHIRRFLLQSFGGLMENKDFKTICGILPVSIAHPFQPCGSAELSEQVLSGISDGEFKALFAKTAALGAGLEINPSCGAPQYVRMNKLAKECGCRFTLGSDTHHIHGMERVMLSGEAAEAAGIAREDMMEFIR